MKRFYLVTLLLWSLVAVAGGTKYVMRVDGLACPYCAYGIERKLKKIEGVEQIDVDLDNGCMRMVPGSHSASCGNQASTATVAMMARTKGAAPMMTSSILPRLRRPCTTSLRCLLSSQKLRLYLSLFHRFRSASY